MAKSRPQMQTKTPICIGPYVVGVETLASLRSSSFSSILKPKRSSLASSFSTSQTITYMPLGPKASVSSARRTARGVARRIARRVARRIVRRVVRRVARRTYWRMCEPLWRAGGRSKARRSRRTRSQRCAKYSRSTPNLARFVSSNPLFWNIDTDFS